MAAAIWLTPAGNLGIIPELEFYELPLDAYDPSGGDVTYSLVSGSMPNGLEVRNDGTIMGIPVNGELQGVPSAVDRVVTSTFTIRVTNSQGLVTDRTFNLTVAGIDPPRQVPSAGQLGIYVDGDYVDIQLGVILSNPLLSASFSLIEGELPPGLTLTNDGRLYGYLTPEPSVEGFGPVGPIWQSYLDIKDPPYFNYGPSFDWQNPDYPTYELPFDMAAYDLSASSVSKNYAFTIQVSDNVNFDADHYTIYVYSRSSLTADNDEVTADLDIPSVTADIDRYYNPVLKTEEGSIGSLKQNVNFAYQFDAEDFDDDPITFQITSGNLPIGLSLHPTSGWVYGIVPYISLGTITYTFSIQVYKTNDPEYVSETKTYTLTLIGQVDDEVVWNTTSDLGFIYNGDISELYISASTNGSRSLSYSLSTIGGLPPGMTLLQDGTISGRPGFDTFALDNNLLSLDHNTTVFDQLYTFTVTVTDSDGLLSASKEFTLKVIQRDVVPYENLYVQILPNRNQRSLYESILNNSDILPANYLYRPIDPWFGRNMLRRVLFQTGLSPNQVAVYVESMERNHYWKNITFGDVKVARALDNNFNPIYEVVYLDLIDNQVNSNGDGPDLSITWPSNSQNITTVYPNSFPNMVERIGAGVGYQNRGILPLWMSSRQTSGFVLGFTRALVLAYVLPGKGSEVAYRIRQFQDEFKLIDFTIDRYEWDNGLSNNFIKENQVGSGTITANTASNVAVGSSTAFLTELLPGMSLYTDNLIIGTIDTITSNNILSFTTNALSNLTANSFEFSTNMFAINSFVNGVGNISANIQSNIIQGISTTINGTGIITGNSNSTSITGIGTLFAVELTIGKNLYYGSNVIGTITSIRSNTQLSLSSVSTIDFANVSYTADGITTAFVEELYVNDTIIVNISNSNVIIGTVKSITNNNQIVLYANSTSNVSDVNFGYTSRDNYSVPVNSDTYLKFPKTNILENVTS